MNTPYKHEPAADRHERFVLEARRALKTANYSIGYYNLLRLLTPVTFLAQKNEKNVQKLSSYMPLIAHSLKCLIRRTVWRSWRIVMRKVLLTLVAAAIGLAASQASAADLPQRPVYKAPVMVAPPPTWTGCYLGGNIGGAFGDASASGPGGSVSGNGSGFAGGGQIGCDYQFAGSGWVIGFRNMFDATSNNRDGTLTVTTAAGTATGTVNFHNRWFDTLTGRLGYAATPDWLLYFQGGAVWSRVEADLTLTTPAGVTASSASDTKTGWTIGGGAEWMFAPHWSAFLEGNYMDFGSRDRVVVTPALTACAAGCAFSTKATAATVLVGVNYRFW
jgi:outer membrane immunogenic protein